MSGGKGGGSKTVETSSDIPERYRDFVDQNLAMAGTIANRAYIPYGGQRIAGFSPDTLSSFGLTRSLGTPLERDLSNAHAAYTAGMNSAADPVDHDAALSEPVHRAGHRRHAGGHEPEL